MNRPTVDEDGEMLDYDGNFCIEYFRRVLNADVESDKEEENDEMGRDYGLITRRDFLRRGGCPLSYFPREERVSLRDRGRYGTPDYVDLTGAPVPPANAPLYISPRHRHGGSRERFLRYQNVREGITPWPPSESDTDS